MSILPPPICPARSWPIGWRMRRGLSGLPAKPPLIHGKRVVGLTHAELKVILALLQGQTIGEQAQRLGLSQKTLYTQRLAGVKSWWNVIRIWPPLSAHAAAALTRKRTDGV